MNLRQWSDCQLFHQPPTGRRRAQFQGQMAEAYPQADPHTEASYVISLEIAIQTASQVSQDSNSLFENS